MQPISELLSLTFTFYVDCNMSMQTHLQLRQLCSISQSVSSAVLQSLVVSLVLSHLDCGNATLALPRNQLNRMQTVINAAARLVGYVHKYKHITPLLCDLHWLLVHEGIEFRIAVSVFCCLRGRVRFCRIWQTSCVVWQTLTQEDGCVLRQCLLS